MTFYHLITLINHQNRLDRISNSLDYLQKRNNFWVQVLPKDASFNDTSYNDTSYNDTSYNNTSYNDTSFNDDVEIIHLFRVLVFT